MVLGFNTKTKFVRVVCLARLPTEAKRNGFFFRFLASRTCSMPRQDFFVPYLLPNHVKYYPNSQNFTPF